MAHNPEVEGSNPSPATKARGPFSNRERASDASFVNRFCKRRARSRCLASTRVNSRALVLACRAGDLERGQRPADPATHAVPLRPTCCRIVLSNTKYQAAPLRGAGADDSARPPALGRPRPARAGPHATARHYQPGSPGRTTGAARYRLPRRSLFRSRPPPQARPCGRRWAVASPVLTRRPLAGDWRLRERRTRLGAPIRDPKAALAHPYRKSASRRGRPSVKAP